MFQQIQQGLEMPFLWAQLVNKKDIFSPLRINPSDKEVYYFKIFWTPLVLLKKIGFFLK